MNILVIGTGYVGTTTALVFAELGWKVTGLDTDQKKINLLRKGKLYFYESGLDSLLLKHLKSGNIMFTTDAKRAIKENQTIFICVGTPSNSDGSVNLQYIEQVANTIGRHMNEYKIIVNKSTVPVGTQERVTHWVRSNQTECCNFDVVSNPEFLREGNALFDALHPDRVIIGSHSEHAANIIKSLYGSLNCPIIITKPKTAELIKYAANAFLATKISYMNELARLCDKTGVNILEVAQGIGLDSRIGESFLQAGIGYGGSCFPKDVNALLNMAKSHDLELSILEKVVNVNQTQYLYFLDHLRSLLGTFYQKTIAVLGLSFKPGTDDTRESRAICLINKLLEEQAIIRVHDPVVKVNPDRFPAKIIPCASPEQAALNVDAVIICTDWPQYRNTDWRKIKQLMKQSYVFDSKNMLDAKEMKQLGFHYQGIGYRSF